MGAVIDFLICKSQSQKKLCEEVIMKLKEGYEFHGFVFMDSNSKGNYCQAMVKKDKV